MHHQSTLRLCVLAALAMLSSAAIADESAKFSAEPVTPTKVIPLLADKDLSLWYTFLQDTGHEDPRHVFTMQDDGVLRISGDGFGGLITRNEYANYHLVIEYRWGTKTWEPRKDRARDNGVLLHCQGPDGNYGGSGGKPGPWMTSIECQIIEGGVGDLLVLSGKDADGKPIPAAVSCHVSRDRDGEAVFTPGGQLERFTQGRVNWFGRDPDWEDVLGFRGDRDVDSPGQEWTRVECFCDGDTLTYHVNGVVVNRAADVTPDYGKILLQTEGAELFVRKFELHPLP